MRIRPEVPADAPVIARVVQRAFEGHPHGAGTEVQIIRSLRASNALSVSLVAEVNGQVRGYVAASPVQVAGESSSWHGLGPVAVDPTVQGMGAGSLLIKECLAQLRNRGAAGCVVLGEPAYYGRFGFKPNTGLTYHGPPPEYFMAVSFVEAFPRGKVTYHAHSPARPNPSLEATLHGLALGPRTRGAYHRARGPSANPRRSPQLKR